MFWKGTWQKDQKWAIQCAVKLQTATNFFQIPFRVSELQVFSFLFGSKITCSEKNSRWSLMEVFDFLCHISKAKASIINNFGVPPCMPNLLVFLKISLCLEIAS